MSRFEDPPPAISEGQLELELVEIALSEVEGRRAPWEHYPHCPECHRRIVSKDPGATYRSSGRYAYPLSWAGSECPWCHAELERTDTST